MKSSELRIGNLYYYLMQDDLDGRRNWKELSIIDIDDMAFLLKNPNDKNFEPIPLTEEWLVRFGGLKSELDDNCYILSSVTVDYPFVKYSCEDGSSYWMCDKIIGDTCISYVHQLQNLYFSLTGNELKYD